MPVQKDIEEGIQTTFSSNVENNDTITHDNINTINNIEASISSASSFPTVTTSINTPHDGVSNTLAPPQEDTDQSTIIANHLQNTSYGHNETEQGYTRPSVGLLQIQDDNIAPLPPIAALESITDSSGIAVGKKTKGKIEQIEDSTSPPLPTTEFDDSDIKRKIAQETTRIDTVNDEEDAPVPFNMSNLDSEEDAKIKSRQLNPSDDIGRRGRDSLAIPTSDDLENDTGLYTTITTPSSLRDRNGGVRGIVGSEEVVENTNSSSLVEGGDNNTNPTSAVAVDRARNEMATILEQGQSDSIPIIPEAFLVEESEDGVVFDAEPWLPWWKRKRFVGFLLLFAACVLAIAIGVGTHFGKRNTVITTQSVLETTPSISPAPSISLAPSSSPSECALTVSTNVQKLDMSKVDKPFETKIAMDKLNSVVVTRESDTTNVHIMFYLLKEGRWESNNHYIEDYGEVGTFNGNWDPSQSKISVALSGKVAMVGFPFSKIELNGGGTGHVFVFEQNDFGVWEKGDPLPIPESQRYSDSGKVYGFGKSIDIDGDAVSILSGNDLHVLENRNGKWKEIHYLELPGEGGAWECFISGSTIAVQTKFFDERIDIYKYDRLNKSYMRIQDSLFGSQISMTFKEDYLMYSTLSWNSDCTGSRSYKPEGFYIYHEQDLSQSYHQTYVLQEFHNITGDGCIPSYRGGKLFPCSSCYKSNVYSLRFISF